MATCTLTANLAQCTDRVAFRPVRFFKALSGVRRSIKSDTYLSYLRHPRRSQVRPPVVGPRCVTIARTPPRAPVAPPPPPPPVVGPRCVPIARAPPAGRRSAVCSYCAQTPPPAGRRSAVCCYCAHPPPPPPVAAVCSYCAAPPPAGRRSAVCWGLVNAL